MRGCFEKFFKWCHHRQVSGKEVQVQMRVENKKPMPTYAKHVLKQTLERASRLDK